MEAKDSFLMAIFQLILSIFTNMEKTNYRAVGVMSGTSLDGIDLVFTEISFKDEVGFSIINSQTIPYSAEWRQKLSSAINLEPAELHQLDIDYTFYLSEIIVQFIQKYDIDLLDAVCSHGHTVKHRPKHGITLQIGNLPKLSEALGIPVVCDFRVQDVELGGQGAPLVPIGDRLLFDQYKYCINLGGFANISLEEHSQRIAYDICPVNTVFNYFMQKIGEEYDENGKLARSGELNEELLQELNSLKFYAKKPPKSLGIEWVNSDVLPIIEKYRIEIPEILKTYAVHVAMQIANSLDGDSNSNVLLTGGGVFNTYLIEELKSRSSCNFIIPDKEVIDFKEALIFALLGILKLRGEINVLSSVTGAKIDHSSGRIFEP
ncbi:anhydro-N-acetylmuramic acid kinase [Gramella sp. MAR_2010_147]|uniref:anhydro-N-acetylmuramic acid kinase n=1 Tax=Gramella sp. MAR_2010_147 TaxID=1250205 RepID=UPI0008795299|nr:anhydro-N-acetylmuramic acid kinase [Gramella sp. MAR_2010_147]SDS53210.1 anhydro-N-acetylmuramic acid kinase [Gramella sp. MAR_2010_147]